MKALAALPEEGRRKNELAIEASQTNGDAFARAGRPHRREKILKRRPIGGIDQLKEGLGRNFLRWFTNERESRGVDLRYARGGRIRNDDGLRGDLKQQTVAELRLTQPRIVPFDRHLSVDKLLLQTRQRPQIAAESNNPAILSHLQGRISDRNMPSARGDMIDFPPARRLLERGLAHQFLDFVTAVGGDGIRPGNANPSPKSGFGKILAADRHIPDDAALVHHKRHIRRRGDQPRNDVSVQRAKRFLRRMKRVHSARDQNLHF